MFYARFLEMVNRRPDAVALEMQHAPTADHPQPAVESYTYRELRAHGGCRR